MLRGLEGWEIGDTKMYDGVSNKGSFNLINGTFFVVLACHYPVPDG